MNSQMQAILYDITLFEWFIRTSTKNAYLCVFPNELIQVVQMLTIKALQTKEAGSKMTKENVVAGIINTYVLCILKKVILPECWSDKLLVAMGILEQDEEVHGPDLGDLQGLA